MCTHTYIYNKQRNRHAEKLDEFPEDDRLEKDNHV